MKDGTKRVTFTGRFEKLRHLSTGGTELFEVFKYGDLVVTATIDAGGRLVVSAEKSHELLSGVKVFLSEGADAPDMPAGDAITNARGDVIFYRVESYPPPRRGWEYFVTVCPPQ